MSRFWVNDEFGVLVNLTAGVFTRQFYKSEAEEDV